MPSLACTPPPILPIESEPRASTPVASMEPSQETERPQDNDDDLYEDKPAPEIEEERRSRGEEETQETRIQALEDQIREMLAGLTKLESDNS